MPTNIEISIEEAFARMVALWEAGDYRNAVVVGEAVRPTIREHLGERHPAYPAALSNLAACYKYLGEYEKAGVLYRDALETVRQSEGSRSVGYASTLNNLAELHAAKGDFVGASRMHEECLELFRTLDGGESARVATSLNNLGCCHAALDDGARAEELHQQALAIDQRCVGRMHRNYATDLNKLADLALRRGDFVRAREMYEEAQVIRREILGDNHPEYAWSLVSLADFFMQLADPSSAIPHLEAAVRIWRHHGGHENPATLDIESRLANAYAASGDRSRASGMRIRILEALERQSTTEPLRYIRELSRMAAIASFWGESDRAEELFRRGLLYLDVRGNNDARLRADVEMNLALVLCRKGDVAQAEALCRGALAVLGDSDVGLRNLAWICAAGGKLREGVDLMVRAAGLQDELVARVSSVASDRQRRAYLAGVQVDVDTLLSMLVRLPSPAPSILGSVLGVVLRRRALALEAQARQRTGVLGGQYPELRAELEELVRLQAQIVTKQLQGPDREGYAMFQRSLAEWKEMADRREQALAARIPELALEATLRRVRVESVGDAIPADAAVVEYVRFKDRVFDANPAAWTSAVGPDRYCAFALRWHEEGSRQLRVHFLDLGTAEAIDDRIHEYRDRLQGTDAGVRDLGVQENGCRTDRGDDLGLELKVDLLDRILGSVTGGNPMEGCVSASSASSGQQVELDAVPRDSHEVTRLFLVPDGALGLLPFEVLPLGNDGRLVDRFRISYLASGRDLLAFSAVRPRPNGGAVVIADPNYDLGDGISAKVPSGELRPRSRPLGDSSAALMFEPLPGSREEGIRVGNLLGVTPWIGDDALKGRLLAAQGPLLVHLATHGFYLPRNQTDAYAVFREPYALGGHPGDQRRWAELEDPMLRCGLALAGANSSCKGFVTVDEAKGGLLTAADLSAMNLLGTRLAVLSACNSGLGDCVAGEGGLGLRRALTIAGVQSVVMSLWSVPDLATEILMEHFYRNLVHGRPCGAALREAQQTLRELSWTELQRIRPQADGKSLAPLRRDCVGGVGSAPTEKPFEDPWFWGGFVCHGNPAVRLEPTESSAPAEAADDAPWVGDPVGRPSVTGVDGPVPSGATPPVPASVSTSSSTTKSGSSRSTLLAVCELPYATVVKFPMQKIVVSPDAKRVAYVVRHEDGKFHVEVNGVRHPTYDLVGGLCFSPNSVRVGYIARKGNRTFVVVDDREYESCDDIGMTSPVFSPDSARVAYTGLVAGAWHVLSDGVPVGGGYASICPGGVVFSSDSSRVGYVVKDGDSWMAVVDGKAEERFRGIIERSWTFTPDSQRFAYFASRRTWVGGEKVFTVVGGEQGAEWDFDPRKKWGVRDELVFGPDGRRLAYMVSNRGGIFFVVDGAPQKAYLGVVSGWEANEVWKSFSGFGKASCKGRALSFSPDGRHYGYAVATEHDHVLVLDGVERQRHPGILNGPVVFSPDSRRWAYGAESMGKQFLVIDGSAGRPFDGLASIEPSFSPDSQHAAYVATGGNDYHLVIDHWVIPLEGAPLVGGALVWDDEKRLHTLIAKGRQVSCVFVELP